MPNNNTITYASKFSPLVDEAFAKAAYTASLINNAYDFIGVDTVTVYSVPTVAMGDYTLTGTSRYGTPTDLTNDTQTLTLTKDRAFTFIIDKKSEQDTMGVMDASKALARQIRDVVIPEVDIYRLAALNAGAQTVETTPITKNNAYEEFLKVNGGIDDKEAPVGGRVVVVTPSYYNKIKLDPSFTHNGDSATAISRTGYVGDIDGTPVIKVPSNRLATGVDFIITNPIALVSPVKLAEYKIHDNAPGISGFLVEGRVRYDAFVLNNKAKAIGVHRAAAQGNG